ncbi:MAG: putative LPS assembly protein LptD [Breznakibacter sp.]
MPKNIAPFILLFFTLPVLSPVALAQEPVDTTFAVTDTTHTVTDTIAAKPHTTKSFIKSEVKYEAADSIIFSLDGDKVFLYKDAKVTYQDVELTAWFIELDLGKNEAYACGTRDSLNKETGLPVYKDKSGEYTMRTMRYNFETRKAKIEHVVTEQGEGYVVSDVAKKSSNNEFCLKGGMYTTCDNHDHPHFGLKMTKAKVIPGKKIVTGPAYLVMEDVPFPVFIPFGFVPSTKKYSSGFLMPSYGEESSRGFFLRNGGYYFAVNDYFDFQTTGDIYTNGSWGLRAASQYKKRYKFSGNFNIQHITNLTSEKDLPDFTKSRDFSLTWSHRQDSKANPYQSFSASVNYSTSSFDRNNVSNIVNVYELAQSTKRSSISYSKRWPTGPFNLSANLLHSQNSRDTTIDLTLPDLTLTMNRVYPFKSKNKVGSNEAWYEKISLSYTANMKNYISTKESELAQSSLNEDWKNGIKHSIPVSMNLKFLKYFTASPSFNYTERWYFNSIRKTYDEDKQAIVTSDTLRGFNRVYDYGYSVGTSTKLYTFFTPWRKIFGDKVNTIRHVMTPSVSMSYRPDFSDPKYGFYDHFEYYNAKTDEIIKYQYSKFENGIYGSPGSGRSGSIGLSLGNSLEMKVKSDRDSTGFAKVKILESLNFSTGYNMLADSLNWSKISMSGRTKIFKTDINFGASFDPYALDTTKSGTPIRINKSHYQVNNKLLRLESANMSFGMSFNNDSFKKKKEGNNNNAGNTPPEGNEVPDGQSELPIDPETGTPKPPTQDNSASMEQDEDGYAKFKMPWNLSFNYSMRLSQGSFNKRLMDYSKEITSDVTINGSISPTPKWSLSFSSGYSFDSKEIAHTSFNIRRNLHCWSMSFNLVPFGSYKSYFFTISANSSMLRDLKYEKRNSYRDNVSTY